MAGDWIKMRVWIARDPRVISMADHLAGDRLFMAWLTDPVRQSCDVTAYEHVTRNVIAALCVTALLVTWGTAREQGDRDGDDLVLRFASLSTLDAMTDLPGFGDSMAAVGWAIEEEGHGIRFPKFFRENETPDEKHKRQAAERQARFRAKQSRDGDGDRNVTDNVTVTTEKSREEKRKNTPIAPKGADGLFEKFYSAYPRKVGKQAALKAFAKLHATDALVSKMVAAIGRQATSEQWRKQGGQFIPHPATWLNEGRWDDEDYSSPITVPGSPERDPALKKLDEDAKKAAPAAPEVRARLADLTAQFKSPLAAHQKGQH